LGTLRTWGYLGLVRVQRALPLQVRARINCQRKKRIGASVLCNIRTGVVPVFLSRQTSASRRQAGAHFDCQRNSHFVALRSNWMHPEVFLHFQVTPKEVDRGIRFTS